VSGPDERRVQLRAAAFIALALAVAGAALGPVWQAWSPAGPFGVMYSSGTQPDETEAWAASDGRFAIIVGAVGLVAGVGVWLLRRARGPYLVVALGAGGIVGGLLTKWVGHLVGGKAHTFACFPPTGKATCTNHLPLDLHMTGLLYLEPAVAILVYGLLVAFAHRDDLGRPDPVREQLLVGTTDQPQYGWGHSDGPGVPQQREFPPQHLVQPGEPFGGGLDLEQ
jgi:hypothetical protein